jgi:RNAse (barnase) inhibitor barstar
MSATWVDLKERLPWLRGERVHVVALGDEPKLLPELAAAGFAVDVIDGHAVRDPASMYEELARALALPEHFGLNADALADALGEVWDGAGRRAVVWRDAHHSLAADVQCVLDAVRLMADTADAVSTWADDGPASAQVEIFLVGAGPGF